MKRKLKKMLAFMLSMALLSVALTACSTSGNSSSDQSSDAVEENSNDENEKVISSETETSEIVTINFWHHYSEQSAENETLMNVLIPKFEEENPGYKVNAVSHEWQELHDKIVISASSNTLPDVARLDIAWVAEFEKMGILVALDQEMEDFEEVSSQLLPSAMSTAYIKEHYYALALNPNTKIMFYNADAFEELGLELPTTTEAFLAAAEVLSGTNEAGQQVWGLDEPALAGWNVLPWIWSNGGEITNEDYTQASGYLNSSETVGAVQMLADMYQKEEMTGFNSGDIPMTDGFGTGRYMMLLEGPWKTAEMAGSYPEFNYGTCVVPAGVTGSVSVLGGEDIAMLNNEHEEGAWLFMQFMTSEYAQEEMAKCGQIPANLQALESDTVKEADFAPFLDALSTAKTRPPVATWSEIDSKLTDAITEIVAYGADAQTTLDELAIEVDELLTQ